MAREGSLQAKKIHAWINKRITEKQIKKVAKIRTCWQGHWQPPRSPRKRQPFARNSHHRPCLFLSLKLQKIQNHYPKSKRSKTAPKLKLIRWQSLCFLSQSYVFFPAKSEHTREQWPKIGFQNRNRKPRTEKVTKIGINCKPWSERLL